MEQKEKIPTVMSVPQFGGWDQNAPGATDYSMVFTQARVNKKHQKINLTEIKSKSLGNKEDLVNTNIAKPRSHRGRGHHHEVQVRNRAHALEDPDAMGKKRILAYMNCCIRP